MRITIKEVASHRNGCFGEPFHAVRFAADGAQLVGLVFAGEGRVAAIDPALAVDTVAFGENSWRGDVYEPALRAAVADYETARAAEPKAAWRPAAPPPGPRAAAGDRGRAPPERRPHRGGAVSALNPIQRERLRESGLRAGDTVTGRWLGGQPATIVRFRPCGGRFVDAVIERDGEQIGWCGIDSLRKAIPPFDGKTRPSAVGIEAAA